MLKLNQINNANLVQNPFKFATIQHVLDDNDVDTLLQNLPTKNNVRSLREEGSDKTYNVVNNLLLPLGEKNPNKLSCLAHCWDRLVNEFTSEPYIKALSTLLHEDLTNLPQEITLKRYGYNDYITAHTDTTNVKATHMIFLNQKWDPAWGGQLAFSSEPGEIFQKFIPTKDLSVVFVRSDNSWHEVDTIVEPSAERIAIQVAFWNHTERRVLPGRIESVVAE